ncbi:hypothetical protein E2C01_046903 [Portunus trituberculatus]|uniref:Uncharacterized protein n=1 Tax=Portunus trituberculatus TaxID=210409 RepID=A0A5B7G614_PORTR|nr:hypothetical protein [Portunus trituberculatus]
MARVPGYLPVSPQVGVPLLGATGFGEWRVMSKHGSKLALQGQKLACLGGQILKGDGTHRKQRIRLYCPMGHVTSPNPAS